MFTPEIWLLAGLTLPVLGGVLLAAFPARVANSRFGINLGTLISALAFVSLCVFSLLTLRFGDPGTLALSKVGLSETVVATDPLSLFWLVFLTGQFTCWIAFHRPWYSGLLMLSISQLAILANDAVFQISMIAVTSWMFARELKENEKSPSSPSRIVFVVLSIADLLWVIGLQGVASVFGGYDLDQILSRQWLTELSESESARLSLGSLVFVISLVIRLGFFPFQFWTRRQHDSQYFNALQMMFPILFGVFLLLRWQPLLTIDIAPSSLFVNLAVFSSLMLAMMSVVVTGGAKISRVAASQLGVICVGSVVLPDANQVCFLAGLILCLPVWLAATRPARLMSISGLLQFLVVAIVMSGVLGQEQVFRTIWTDAITADGLISPSVCLMLYAAHAICVWSVAEWCFETRLQEPNSSSTLLWGGLGATATSLAVMSGHQPFLNAISVTPVWTGVASLAIFTIVFWRHRHETVVKLSPNSPKSLASLLQDDFHTETAIRALFVVPTELLSIMFSEANEFLFERCPAWCLNFARGEVQVVEELEEPKTSVSHVVVVALTLVVLIACLIFANRS